MPYATFIYRFEKRRIVDPSRVGVVRSVGHDRIVLTACHPPTALPSGSSSPLA
jgi:sortase A